MASTKQDKVALVIGLPVKQSDIKDGFLRDLDEMKEDAGLRSRAPYLRGLVNAERRKLAQRKRGAE